jgi:hypothetical protein
MEKAFITRAPSANELNLFKKYLGSYRDGSGNNREDGDGSSRADSRQIERCFAELLDGTTTENKAFYDFVIESNENGSIAVRGASIKSKEIPKLLSYRSELGQRKLRAHLEISNSSSKDWELCSQHDLTEDHFREGMYAEKFGAVMLERQKSERLNSEQSYISASRNSTKVFINRDSVFISILYSPAINNERNWLVSSFSINLPEPNQWIKKGKCIVGLDEDGDKLYEWYALSGSQFKYYPKIKSRLHGTDLFTLPRPANESLRAKANRLFGI